MESFFSSLKAEHAAHKVYRTRDDAKAKVFDCIERLTTQPPVALEVIGVSRLKGAASTQPRFRPTPWSDFRPD